MAKAPSPWREFQVFWLDDAAKRRQLLLLWLAIAAALAGTQWFRLEKDLACADQRVAPAAEVAYVAPVAVMRIASLGNQGFLADLIFLRAAHYFVDHLITDSRLPWLDLYLEALWGLDAHNRQSYRWGSQVVKFGQRIDDSVARRANRFARLGMEYFPSDAWLYHEIAFNLRYDVVGKDAAEQKHLRELALKYLELAYSFPGFTFDPAYLVMQYSRSGFGDDSVRAALATYSQATQEQRLTLRALLVERDKASLAGQLSWLELVRQRDWPYAGATLPLWLGPRTLAAPPLQAHRPEGYLRPLPTPAEIANQYDTATIQPLGDDGWRADERAGRDLP